VKQEPTDEFAAAVCSQEQAKARSLLAVMSTPVKLRDRKVGST
jgi:hypothetical protein